MHIILLYRLAPELGSGVQVLEKINRKNESTDLDYAPRNSERATTRLDIVGESECLPAQLNALYIIVQISIQTWF